MTAYYVRAMAGRQVLQANEIEKPLIEEVQFYATHAFLSNLRLESIGLESLKVDILMQGDPSAPTIWTPYCRGRWRGKAVGWVWAYRPAGDD